MVQFNKARTHPKYFITMRAPTQADVSAVPVFFSYALCAYAPLPHAALDVRLVRVVLLQEPFVFRVQLGRHSLAHLVDL